MKLLALLLLVSAAIAAAVPARLPDGSLVTHGAGLPESVLAGAIIQNTNLMDFNWSTEEYCGDDGALRARGKFHVNGFDDSFEFDTTRHKYESLEIDGKDLHIVYDFDKYVTNFWYGDCHWGQLSARCGMCVLQKWEGQTPDCKDANRKHDIKSRSDRCYMQIKGTPPPPPEHAEDKIDTIASRDLVPSDANGKSLENRVFHFTWATKEYCVNGHLLATAMLSTPTGYRREVGISGPYVYTYLPVKGQNLIMHYNFGEFYTDFQYGDCKWGTEGQPCGTCTLDYEEGSQLDCGPGHSTGNTRYRSDKCYMQVDASVAATVASRDLAAPSESDKELTSPNTSEETQAQAEFEFNWSTKEYCDGGNLRALATLKSGSYTSSIVVQPFFVAGLTVGDKELKMEYKFLGYYTAFEYGDCRWGEHDPSCGSCKLEKKEGDKVECGPGHDTTATRFRSDNCRMNVEGAVARILAQLGSGEGPENELVARDLASESDEIITLPVVQSADTAEPAAEKANGKIGYRTITVSVTEECEASEGTPLIAHAYIWEQGSPVPGVKIYYTDDGRVAQSVDFGYPGVTLLVGPYTYGNSVLSFHYGGCHWDQDAPGIGNCGFCNSSPWSSSNLNCAMNAAAARNHVIECKVGVEWDEANAIEKPMIAARDDYDDAIDSSKRNDDTTVDEPTPTPTSIPDGISTATAADSETTILTFHYTLHEYCFNGKLEAWGHYQSGGFGKDTNLPRGLMNSVDHLVRPYPPLIIGDYKYDSHHLRFAYNVADINCEWFDNEKDKHCGECRAAEWTQGELDCSLGGLRDRTKEMGCSFILGVSQT